MSLHPIRRRNYSDLLIATSKSFRGAGRSIIERTQMQLEAVPREFDANQISTLLRAWSDGDQSALTGLTPIVHDEPRRLAHRYMRRERPGHTLQTTSLVNEAYMRLVEYERMKWQDRAHFFAVSSQVMRRLLVDHARSHNVKRGAGVAHGD